jgi:hypothetical protein
MLVLFDHGTPRGISRKFLASPEAAVVHPQQPVLVDEVFLVEDGNVVVLARLAHVGSEGNKGTIVPGIMSQNHPAPQHEIV